MPGWKEVGFFTDSIFRLLIRTRMDIVTLPVTGHRQEIQDSFLRELSLRVDIKDNMIDKKVQIIIFKPFGRPKEEFDYIIQTYKETGRRLDENIIFITVTKPDRCKFEVPSHFNFALKIVLFLNDENEIEPQSSNAMDQIADHLIRKYGFKPHSHTNPYHDVTTGKVEFPTPTLTKVEGQIKRDNENATLKRKLKDLGQGHHEVQQENKRLNRLVQDLGQKHHDVQQENKELNRLVEETQHEKQGERKAPRQGGGPSYGLLEQCQDGVMPEIRFKSTEVGVRGKWCWLQCLCFSYCEKCCGDKEYSYSVKLNAVGEKIRNLPNGNYKFQRKYEEKFQLEPGSLKRVLEYIGDELEKRSTVDDSIVEGGSFHTLTKEVNTKFGLSPDNFREFLKHISTRYDQGKGWQKSTDSERRVIMGEPRAFPSYGNN